jgi:hypothetical protein
VTAAPPAGSTGFGGLTPASHRQFLQRYHPAINRMAYGPPLRRNQQLLALMEAG